LPHAKHVWKLPSRSALIERISELLDYLFGLLYGLLLVRFVLDLLNARPGAGFVRFIRDLTNPFYAPFKGIVANGAVEGARIVWPLVVAVIAYVLLHATIRGFFRLVTRG
jgi:YggT family protein